MRLLECLYVECSPVLDAAIQSAHMDEVKAFLCKEPFFAAVADLEGQIWRDPRWLNWRKIGSDDACGRMLVGEVTIIESLILHFVDVFWIRTLPICQCRYRHQEHAVSRDQYRWV